MEGILPLAALRFRIVWRRGRFDELIRRQLAIFTEDEAGLFAEAEEADAAWTNAGADEAEELYGDYQLVADAIGERLHEVRETYAMSLDDATVDEYRAAFDRAARKRFGRLASFLDEG